MTVLLVKESKTVMDALWQMKWYLDNNNLLCLLFIYILLSDVCLFVYFVLNIFNSLKLQLEYKVVGRKKIKIGIHYY